MARNTTNAPVVNDPAFDDEIIDDELNEEMNDDETTNTNATPTDDKKDPRYIAIVMTPELLTAIRDNAPAGTGLGGYLRTIVANHLGVTITPTATRTKYANEADKKAAQTAARKSRNDLIKELLAAHKAKLATA